MLRAVVAAGVVPRFRANTPAPGPGPPVAGSGAPVLKATMRPSPETADSRLGRLNSAPVGSTLTRSLTSGDCRRARKYTSVTPLLSGAGEPAQPCSRLVASDVNATPSAVLAVSLVMWGAELCWSPIWLPQLRLTSSTVDAERVRRYTSVASLSSVPLSERRLVASEAKAIWSPSPEIDGLKLSPLPWTELPPFFTETSWVVLAVRSRQNTSVLSLLSLATRSVARWEIPVVQHERHRGSGPWRRRRRTVARRACRAASPRPAAW